MKQHNKGYQDGYQRGLLDGSDERIKQLTQKIEELTQIKGGVPSNAAIR